MLVTFSNYPSARAGVALLLLRTVVGTSSILEAGLMLARNNAQEQAATIAAALAVAAGLAVIIGFLTPLAIMLICLAGVLMMLARIPPAALLLLDSRMAAFEFVVELATLMLLGPGAISVDARLFGRREVAIRDAPRLNDS